MRKRVEYFVHEQSYLHIPLLIFIGFIFFVPYLGAANLFDWDEVNFAESAREMLVSGDYSTVQINFQPFWEKPPLFFWLQMISMKMFGVNAFAARFPNAIIGIITLVVLYLFGTQQKNRQLGFLWALCYIGSFLPHLYFKSAIIDPLFNLFIFSSVYFLYMMHQRIKYLDALLCGLFAGLAMLTKGPVGPALIAITAIVFWVVNKGKLFPKISLLLIAVVFFIISGFSWYAYELLDNGNGFFKLFIDYHIKLLSTEDAGHGQPFFYHFLVVLIGCFPMSVFGIAYILKLNFLKRYNYSSFHFLMFCLFAIVLIIFSLVKTKIVHYSSLTYFPLSFLAAWSIQEIFENRQKLTSTQNTLFLIIGNVFAVLLIFTPLAFQFPGLLTDSIIKDPFFKACLSNTKVDWNGLECLVGVAYLILVWTSYFLSKKEQERVGFGIIFGGTAITLWIYSALIVPKIDAYMQKPAIDFYRSLKSEECYITTIGFKSYAHYFYPEVRPHKNKDAYSNDKMNEDWMLYGQTDKPSYFVAKYHKLDSIIKWHPHLKLIKQKGGYVFFKRDRFMTWENADIKSLEYTCDAEKISPDYYFPTSHPEVFLEKGRQITSFEAHSGRQSLFTDSTQSFGFVHLTKRLKNKSKVYVEVWRKGGEGHIVVNKDPKSYFSSNRVVEVAANGWEKVVAEVIVPANIGIDEGLSIYVMSTSKKVYWDDLKVRIEP